MQMLSRVSARGSAALIIFCTQANDDELGNVEQKHDLTLKRLSSCLTTQL